MPNTARDLGVDVHDEKSSAWGAARYLSSLRSKFGGSLEKAVAAYNLGPGKLSKALAEAQVTGRDWHSLLPKETSDYVNTFMASQPRLDVGADIQKYGADFQAKAAGDVNHVNNSRTTNTTINNIAALSRSLKASALVRPHDHSRLPVTRSSNR